MKSKLSRGLFWMTGLKGATRLATFVRLAILARLLSPAEFGLFGIATLALALIETLTDTGVNVFFIQKEGKLEEYLNTAWVVSIFRGLLIFFILFIFSTPIAIFFHSPSAALLVRIIAFGALLRGFINPMEVSFQKDMHFNKEFFFRTSIIIVDYGVSIILGIITRSAISLVWGMIAGITVELVLSHLILKPRPSLVFDQEKFIHVLRRGKWITAAGVFQYLFGNGDNIVVGRLMESMSLGFYQMAYRISTIPLTEIGDVFSKVTFPALSEVADRPKEVRRLFWKSQAAIFILTAPLSLVLLFFTQPLVSLLLGSTWLSIVPSLKVLSLFGVIRALQWGCNPVFLAFKKQEYVTYVTVASLLGLGITIVPFVTRFGMLGAAWSAFFGTIISLPVTVYFLAKIFSK